MLFAASNEKTWKLTAPVSTGAGSTRNCFRRPGRIPRQALRIGSSNRTVAVCRAPGTAAAAAMSHAHQLAVVSFLVTYFSDTALSLHTKR